MGTVFELTPPASPGGTWTKTVLHAFTGGSDGSNPPAALIADSKGNLYGTTLSGGASNDGTVFELMPPASPGGTWTETVLHAFTGGSDGSIPYAGLIAGKGIPNTTTFGLYGTTFAGGASNVGTVFELIEPTRRICSQCSTPLTCCVCAAGMDGNRVPLSGEHPQSHRVSPKGNKLVAAWKAVADTWASTHNRQPNADLDAPPSVRYWG
jgi:uncharacterized repeat protein (TIGR03803 family)